MKISIHVRSTRGEIFTMEAELTSNPFGIQSFLSDFMQTAIRAEEHQALLEKNPQPSKEEVSK